MNERNFYWIYAVNVMSNELLENLREKWWDLNWNFITFLPLAASSHIMSINRANIYTLKAFNCSFTPSFAQRKHERGCEKANYGKLTKELTVIKVTIKSYSCKFSILFTTPTSPAKQIAFHFHEKNFTEKI